MAAQHVCLKAQDIRLLVLSHGAVAQDPHDLAEAVAILGNGLLSQAQLGFGVVEEWFGHGRQLGVLKFFFGHAKRPFRCRLASASRRAFLIVEAFHSFEVIRKGTKPLRQSSSIRLTGQTAVLLQTELGHELDLWM